MAYHASTDPKTVAGVGGVANEYTNFNAVNTPVLASTGTVSATGTNKVYFVGSSSNAVGGNSQSSGTTANIPVRGVQYLIPSGSSTPFYQLDTPSEGAKVTLFAVASNTSHPIRVYTNKSSSLSVPIINGGLNGVASTSNNMITMARGTVLSLLGYSTGEWLVESISTHSSTGATSYSSST